MSDLVISKKLENILLKDYKVRDAERMDIRFLYRFLDARLNNSQGMEAIVLFDDQSSAIKMGAGGWSRVSGDYLALVPVDYGVNIIDPLDCGDINDTSKYKSVISIEGYDPCLPRSTLSKLFTWVSSGFRYERAVITHDEDATSPGGHSTRYRIVTPEHSCALLIGCRSEANLWRIPRRDPAEQIREGKILTLDNYRKR